MATARGWFWSRSLSWIWILGLGLALLTPGVADKSGEPNEVLVVVLDGLRPEYITPEFMPRLHALGERGVVAERHHAVFPTVTRVNAASLATGATPGRHGLLHNTIHLPEVQPESFSSANLSLLKRTDEITGGRLLTATSLGEQMAEHGLRLWALGSCGNGTAFLLNHRLTGHGSASARGFVAPDSSKELILAKTGPFPPPPQEPPARAINQWAVDAFLRVGLEDFRPHATILWITDPDYTTHREGVGAPLVMEAVRHVDQELGRLLDGIRQHGLEDRINVFVTTDHGFSTLTRELYPEEAVAASGIDPDSYHVVPTRGKVYVRDSDRKTIQTIVRTLQRNELVGAIFTRGQNPGGHLGTVPGTLSLASVDYHHDRSPDILFDATWNSEVNEHGFAGHTTQSRYPANHGTSSPFDIGIHLLAAGPDLKKGLRSQTPTGNIDLAPTICHLLGIPPADSMEGRVLSELLAGGPDPLDIPVGTSVHSASTQVGETGITYEVRVHRFEVGGTSYLHRTEAERTRL